MKISKHLEVSLEKLSEETIEKFFNGSIQEEGISYFLKDIGEEKPIGFFVIVNSLSNTEDLNHFINLAKKSGCTYIDFDDIY